MNVPITHNEQKQAFYATVKGYEAKLTYTRPAADLIDFAHTFVDENLRGQGVGEELARTALTYARDQRLRVLTSCRFVATYVQRHPAEYADLLAKA